MTPVWRSRAAGTCHSEASRQASSAGMRSSQLEPASHTAICKHHAPNTSANARPFFTPLHTAASTTAPSSSCRAPSRAVLTGTTALLMTIATTTTTDTPNDMTTDTMNHHATGAAMTDMTTDTPNAMTTDTMTATQSPQAARGGIATILPPPSLRNHTTHAGAPTRLHPTALERASRPAEKTRGKTPSWTTWAKLPSSSA